MQHSLRSQPRFGFPLFLAMALLSAFLLWLALSRTYTQLEELTSVEATAEANLSMEMTRSVELLITKTYVDSIERLGDYYGGEAQQQKVGELTVRVNVTEVPYEDAPQLEEADVNVYARPWQMWWQLLSDEPIPVRD